MLSERPEPIYENAADADWISRLPYGTIHRVASDGIERGIFSEILSFCKDRFEHLRLDTHRDNVVMQHLAEKNGFKKCGIIQQPDGSLRLAYEYIKK